jgi:hypothetical protein
MISDLGLEIGAVFSSEHTATICRASEDGGIIFLRKVRSRPQVHTLSPKRISVCVDRF